MFSYLGNCTIFWTKMSARRPSIIKIFLSIIYKSESENQKNNTTVIFFFEQIISSYKYFMQIISITGLLPLLFLLIIPNKITSHSIQYSMVRIAALFAFWKFEFFENALTILYQTWIIIFILIVGMCGLENSVTAPNAGPRSSTTLASTSASWATRSTSSSARDPTRGRRPTHRKLTARAIKFNFLVFQVQLSFFFFSFIFVCRRSHDA